MVPRQQAKVIRGDLTREKLLTASIDVFGRYGFDGATTRMLTDAAGVNQQAIPYYFGSKEGLYIATAEFIAQQIGVHVCPMREKVRGRFLRADEAATRSVRRKRGPFSHRSSRPWRPCSSARSRSLGPAS